MLKVDPIFAEAVTSTAFNLTLSRSMIIRFIEIANKKGYANLFRSAGLYSTEVPTSHALLRRGLVYAPNPELPGHYALTEAGEHLYALLKIAGLVEPVEAKLKKEPSHVPA